MHPINATISPHRVGTAGNDLPLVLQARHNQSPHISMDIGGSLVKLVWWSTSKVPGGRLNFRRWETKELDTCLDFVEKLLDSDIPLASRILCLTGGGAVKYFSAIKSRLGDVDIRQDDEMSSLVRGLDFLLHNVQDEVFTLDKRKENRLVYEEVTGDIYPCLLVNIGSGVSVIKINGSGEEFERISGSSLGGGTFWGLLSVLTNAKSYDEMLDLCSKGHNEAVDLTVGDIFGTDYDKISLKSSTIASTFGKVFRMNPQERQEPKPEDMAQSILFMLCNHISQLAYMNARLSGTNRILFGGSFTRGHALVMSSISYGIDFWSGGTMKAYFLRHEGYVGAVGAFMKHWGEGETKRKIPRSGSIFENFTLARGTSASIAEVGALDFLNSTFVPFPLLSLPGYVPDTMDLTNNPTLTAYWVDLLEKNLHILVELAVEWERKADLRDEVVEVDRERAKEFEQTYRRHLRRLKEDPAAYGQLSVRTLLNLREQCLLEVAFYDLYEYQKLADNEAAMEALPAILEKLDTIQDERELIDTLVTNVVAMNMFDLGAINIIEMMRRGELTFSSAKDKMNPSEKLWHMDRLIEAFQTRDWPKKTVVFCDNSGADILLGVIPLVRWLLNRRLSVAPKCILAANTSPSVNDVTADELQGLIERVSGFDDTIREGIEDHRLQVFPTGSSGPCLDLRRVDSRLASVSEDADLVVLVGMGRSIHTNFHARFHVPSLKLAVFKNASAAEYLGVSNFDGMCVFEDGV